MMNRVRVKFGKGTIVKSVGLSLMALLTEEYLYLHLSHPLTWNVFCGK